MLPAEIIRAKREGAELTERQIFDFISGIQTGQVDDCQVAAFAMVVCCRSMNANETGLLTEAMAHSGLVTHWDEQDLGGPILDKHSSGGVGDKVSIALMPILVACGAFVPMVSGRGLGHSGGTLDKLDAIPGYNTEPSTKFFVNTVKQVGGAIVSASADIAPADKKLYSIRDTIAAVDSVPLITASILSKKIAAGISRLVMDVKVGSGAFMPDISAAEKLVESLLAVAEKTDVHLKVLLTDMNQVLGTTVGNAIETLEAVMLLTDHKQADRRLLEVTVELAAELLVMGKLASDLQVGRNQIHEALSSGKAAEALGKIVAVLGGPNDFVDKPRQHLKIAPVKLAVHPHSAGKVAAIDVRTVGIAMVEMKGGRRTKNDKIDLQVGLDHVAGIGSEVGPGRDDRPLAMVYVHDDKLANAVAEDIRAAYTLNTHTPDYTQVVLERRE